MFIVIVFGVLLIIGVAYVYKKVKAFKKAKAFKNSMTYEEAEEAFNKVKEVQKAKDEADKVFWEAKEALEATPQWKAYEEAEKALKATPEWKAEKEALCACQKMHIAYVEADSDLRKVKRFAKSTLKEEMEEEAW